MKRTEIEQYIGKRVSAWTAMNGSYSGILIRLLPCKPWRGIVKIDGVLECWCCYQAGRGKQRRGLVLGQEYEFGNSSIKPDERKGHSKVDALRQEIASCKDWLNRPESKHAPHYVAKKIIEEAEKQLRNSTA